MCGCVGASDETAKQKTRIIQSDLDQILDKQLFKDDLLSINTEIHISCEKLADKDIMSKSDPFAVLFSKDKNG